MTTYAANIRNALFFQGKNSPAVHELACEEMTAVLVRNLRHLPAPERRRAKLKIQQALNLVKI